VRNLGKEKRQQYRIIAKIVYGKGKGKDQPKTGNEVQEECRLIRVHFLKPRVERHWWSTSVPGHFNPGKYRVPIVYKAGWATEPVWTGAEYLAAAGIRSSNCPARSELLHQLRYLGPIVPSTAT
jgi:hypothetical protein